MFSRDNRLHWDLSDANLGGAEHLRLRLQVDLRRRRLYDQPYEIIYPGGDNEHWNPETGEIWLGRALAE